MHRFIFPLILALLVASCNKQAPGPETRILGYWVADEAYVEATAQDLGASEQAEFRAQQQKLVLEFTEDTYTPHGSNMILHYQVDSYADGVWKLSMGPSPSQLMVKQEVTLREDGKLEITASGNPAGVVRRFKDEAEQAARLAAAKK